MKLLRRIEGKWQTAWEKARIFEVNPDPIKPKYFITVAYPYPNSPQHIGHGRTYTLADVHARYMRMRGYNVLFPMAFHYTGTPVLAMSKHLITGDEDLIDTFLRIYHVPKETLKVFTEPINIARYFHEEIKTGMRDMGYSIDWRREFTTIDPQYNRFIEWQFRKLQEAGFISQGSHPVGWCPSCGNPVGQHDTVGDVEPEIEEFSIIKFGYGECFLPAATLRPETVFGVTNMWLNPKAAYVRARVNNEQWIISKESVEKLQYLSRKVDVTDTFLGKELIGKEARNPATNEGMLILPADFVDPKNATGVVMSVPGHAPYDYVALESLRKEAFRLKEYGITSEAIGSVKPISIITVPNYSEIPAADVVKQMGIESQLDPKLEEATGEVYRHEFHSGKMRENTGIYAGLSVAEAKEMVKRDLVTSGKAETMYELINRPVVCRCGAECIVKIFEDQWFINYGKPEWKVSAHQCLDQMEILPGELRQEFRHVIDWLHEKACARRAGLGTKLPWDPKWIIESLSDSVIYMAYYTIVKHIKEYGIQPNQLTDAVFDHLFLGVGELNQVAKEADLKPNVLEQMRNEFSCFYPLDSRHSGRDLVPNHLTFMIFNHTAIFPEKLWPRQIVVNGSVLMEGQIMSKSLGNIVPLREAIQMFGADPLRIAVLSTAELLQDADFSSSLARARSMHERLERFYRFAIEATQIAKDIIDSPFTSIDRWMLSRLQEHIRMATEAMDKLMVRKAVHSALYMLDQDFQWYLRRIAGEKETQERRGAIAKVFNEILDAQVRMLAPITPHICEEVWEKMGRKGFISLASWPTYDKTRVDVKAEENEELIKNMQGDTLNIIKATRIAPQKICYYVAAPWKWKAYLKSLEKSISTRITLADLMKELMTDPDLKRMAERVSRFAHRIIEEVNRMAEDKKRRRLQIGSVDESRVLREAESFFEREFHAKVSTYLEEDPRCYDPKRRAGLACPYRPAIYVE
ncbi:MAG: Leucine--tRNA ligase [Candidatus Bathyarchaeota archaeon BA1]|nr:MAG: Leucine--tRNA ligase [Candidatus Bathyarchaeota archaeon BA1]